MEGYVCYGTEGVVSCDVRCMFCVSLYVKNQLRKSASHENPGLRGEISRVAGGILSLAQPLLRALSVLSVCSVETVYTMPASNPPA